MIDIDPWNNSKILELWQFVLLNRHYVPEHLFISILTNYLVTVDNIEFHSLWGKYKILMRSQPLSAATVYGSRLLVDPNAPLEATFIESIKSYAIQQSSLLLQPALLYDTGAVTYDDACSMCADTANSTELSLCIDLIEAIRRGNSLTIFSFPANRFQVTNLRTHHDLFLFGMSLLETSGGTLILLLYALIKADLDLVKQLIRHGRTDFNVPILTTLYNDLELEFNDNGKDTIEFQKLLRRLVFTIL